MALSTATAKNLLANAYAGGAVSVALYTTAPSGSAGTEVTGTGYARQTPAWSAAVAGVSSTIVNFTVPAGQTIAGFGLYTAGGTFLDGASVTSQPFPTGGTYQLTISFTEA